MEFDALERKLYPYYLSIEWDDRYVNDDREFASASYFAAFVAVIVSVVGQNDNNSPSVKNGTYCRCFARVVVEDADGKVARIER